MIGVLAVAATATVAAVSALLAAFAQNVWFVGLRRPAWAPSLSTLIVLWSNGGVGQPRMDAAIEIWRSVRYAQPRPVRP